MRDAELNKFVNDDAKNKRKRTGNFGSVKVLPDGTEHVALSYWAVKLFDYDTDIVLDKVVFTRLIYSFGLTKLVFFQIVVFYFSTGS